MSASTGTVHPRPKGVPIIRPEFQSLTTRELKKYFSDYDAEYSSHINTLPAADQRKALVAAAGSLHSELRAKGYITLWGKGEMEGKKIDMPPEPPRGHRTPLDIKRELFLRAGALQDPEVMARLDMNTILEIQRELNLTPQELKAYYEADSRENLRPAFQANKFKKILTRLNAAKSLTTAVVADAKKAWLTCREDEYMASVYDAGFMNTACHLFELLSSASLQVKNSNISVDVRYYLSYGLAEILLNDDVRRKLLDSPEYVTALLEHIDEGFQWCLSSTLSRSKRTPQLLVYAKFLADVANIGSPVTAPFFDNSSALSKGLIACAVDEDADVRTKMGGPVKSPIIEHGARAVNNLMKSRVGIDSEIIAVYLHATLRPNAQRRCPTTLALQAALRGHSVPKPTSVLSGLYTAVQTRRTCTCCSKEENPASPFKMCARCKQARYCDASCQKQHWKVHKANCSAGN